MRFENFTVMTQSQFCESKSEEILVHDSWKNVALKVNSGTISPLSANPTKWSNYYRRIV